MKKGSIEEFTLAASILNDILVALGCSIMNRGYVIQKSALALRSNYRDCIDSYDMLSHPGEKDRYVDSLIQECINNMGSALQGKEFIKKIIRDFHHVDDYCCPDYEIIDNVVSKKGFIEAYKKIKYDGYKRSSCECTEREYFVFEFQDLYQKFIKRFLELCKDGGFDYYEIKEQTFPSDPNETPVAAPQELPAPQLPKELREPKAIDIFTKAVEVGLMERHGDIYKWLGSDRECVYFAKCFNVIIWGKPNENPKDRSKYKNERFKWKPFEQAFGKKNFAQEWRKIDFEGFDYPDVDKVFS